MDREVRGALMHYAVFLIFLGVRWSPVFSAPTPSASVSCADLNNTVDHAKLFREEATKLWTSFETINKDLSKSAPPEVPDSEIPHTSIAEKLQNVCYKNKLFILHLKHAQNYLKELVKDPKVVEKAFKDVQIRLGYLTNAIKNSISAPNSSLTTPAPLTLSHQGDIFKMKEYVWGITFSLKKWSKKMEKVVEELKKPCGQQ